MKKLMLLATMLILGIVLIACDNSTDVPTDPVTVTEDEISEEMQVLTAVTVEVIAHENHDHDHHDTDDHDNTDDHTDDYDHDHDGEGIGSTHHFHFAVDVEGTVSHELHGTSENHFELKLTPFGGYKWAEDVSPTIEFPELLEGSRITSYIDDHGCLVIIVEFPE